MSQTSGKEYENMVRVITINILFELEDWEERRVLLVNELKKE